MSDRTPLRSVFGTRTLVADGGMGTMLQGYDLKPADFGGLEGCNEMLNLTRPEIVAEIHRTYFEAGADLVETNTFGANLTALTEYGLADRLEELAEAGARIARQVADESDRPRWVLGSVGPGTKLAALGQISYAEIRDATTRQVQAMLAGGIDAVIIETAQDLLGVRAAVAGAKKAIREAGTDTPILVSVTIETTGTLLVGSDLTAIVATLAPLKIDALGLNCATGPDGMREPLKQLAAISPVPITCMPNAGLPVLTENGAYYPLSPDDFADAVAGFAHTHGLALVGGCCGTTPDHIRALSAKLAEQGAAISDKARGGENSRHEVASLYSATDLTQDISYLSIGERTNASGSRAFRDAMLAADWDRCVEIARGQAAEGAHVLDLCVDYVGRDGKHDMAELASRISREVDLPIQVDSSDPEVIRVGLELCPGRSIVNSVTFESGAGPGSKFATTMEYAREHGAAVVALCIDEEGQARTVEEKLTVARRFISVLTSEYGMEEGDIIIDPLTFPIATGQEDTRLDAAHTIEAMARLHAEFPAVHLLAGVSNLSFGLKPSARAVLNSIYLDQCRRVGLDCAIVPTSKILPLSSIPSEQIDAAMNLIWDNGENPLEAYLALFEGATARPTETIEDLPVETRLRRHILDGLSSGLEEDLRQAVETKPALAIINEDLLAAMKEVGERFGSGAMQLPFVLKSAEVMKKAVTFLEPHLDRIEGSGKGTLVLATVRGDVHDIGKNLVDIILTNNGYRVVNLGIKQPIADIITAAETVGADAIGMSGLLVKSTQIMKENLEELNERGLGAKYPVLLGGAALTRAYVETDLDQVYTGEVRYARDAFEGLALMDAVMARKAGTGDLPSVTPRETATVRVQAPAGARSSVTRPGPGAVPSPPFFGVRQGRATLDEVLPWLDKRALFAGQWGLKSVVDGPSYEQMVAVAGEPRLAWWLDQVTDADLFDFRVIWGYWPCHSSGDDLILKDGPTFTFPRQGSGEYLCLADYFRDEQEASELGEDVVGLQLVTAGEKVGQRTAELFAEDSYRDYFELHGLSVQMTEAFAEMWHDRIRTELGLAPRTDQISDMVAHQAYQGERFSFGYPACPDLRQRRMMMEVLKPELIGVTLSEEYQLHPEQSTDALIVHHPQAHYFSVR